MFSPVSSNELPCIIIGAGGHAKVIISTLKASGREILFLSEKSTSLIGSRLLDIPILGTDSIIYDHPPETVKLILGLGAAHSCSPRKKIWQNFSQAGYLSDTVIHPTATICDDVSIGEGAQIFAHTVIQPGCHIGAFSIINTGAQIDHDCNISSFSHIGPGAILCGNINIEEEVFVGAGSIITPSVNIQSKTFIVAGSVITKDIFNSPMTGKRPPRNL